MSTPGTMLRSYLVVGLGFILFFCLVMISVLAVSYFFFFPEIDDWQNRDPEEVLRILSTNSSWCFSFLTIALLSAFLMGVFVSWAAPFAKFGHGVFLTVLLFVTLLQNFLQNEGQVPSWLSISLLGFVPLASLFGAKTWAMRDLRGIEETQEESPAEDDEA